MTQTPLKPLYGPVAEDMILVEDVLESIKQVELAPLKRMLDHALEARGKRLRPALVLLTGNLGDYNLNKLVPLGAAIELLHTASLVHDDVVDGALSRRGRPTTNAVFDNAITVLLGDYMFANAAEMVTRTGSLSVTRLFALALMKMTSGELDQDAAAFDMGKDVQQYLWRIGGKTAALIANATEGGAVLGGLDEKTVEALRTYGYSLGMAFQIVDDILDYTGDEELMGKPVGSDLLEGTVTLPGLLFLERYPGTTRSSGSSPPGANATCDCRKRSERSLHQTSSKLRWTSPGTTSDGRTPPWMCFPPRTRRIAWRTSASTS
ncbi:MAG: polyprenyl synthetase family protein [Dehalococcoidia bacterium]|uniref:polyprenyl synthetase family protein n=1 Tax=Candidatus Amarobacter glycogenicus TaxID=3140699 RepID=UPI0031365B15|nr:polyprenyl synthetase family protein [Dehalococcoidia bacterium]